ncbi:MAG: hypothetical protein ACK4NH_01425 [Gemmobacter sp.]
MVITVVLLGMVAGIASGIAAVMAGMPIWALAVIYPVGGLACVGLMLSVMFLSMPAHTRDAEFTGTAKAN